MSEMIFLKKAAIRTRGGEQVIDGFDPERKIHLGFIVKIDYFMAGLAVLMDGTEIFIESFRPGAWTMDLLKNNPKMLANISLGEISSV